MSKDEYDEEEQSFLREVTSHLPAVWSDERRDTYVQDVLISWRKHREHSRDEERLMEKYLATIKQHFKAQSPELYDFSQWPIDEKLTAILNCDSLDPDIVQQVFLYQFVMKGSNCLLVMIDTIIRCLHICFSSAILLPAIGE